MSENRMNGAGASIGAGNAAVKTQEWSDFSTHPLTPDSDATAAQSDGMPDGWELYVSCRTGTRVMAINPWNPLDGGDDIDPPGAPAPQVRIHTVEPRSFSEAQSIADKFRAGQPVIMNLVVTDPDLARRLLDFASGLTYGLGGGLQKVSDKVFMLSPANVDVSATGARLREGGMFSME